MKFSLSGFAFLAGYVVMVGVASFLQKFSMKQLNPYQVNFLMRGYYQLGPLLLESGDLFGLHRRFRVETKPARRLETPMIRK